ncbi:phosphoenolpyruvate carboxykinase (ATP) [Cellulomonas palmilytica]|uniref:hypothetical protein n=1 Tax=Cellulomonas palmilytica TaxID=2608402 RepID=UPI001F27CD77|nr:hypothetical protein [Cellulomonas palmilytica]UJP40677.1 hypothetical protein F1D97_04025 [Cellulomonas palmilytica]
MDSFSVYCPQGSVDVESDTPTVRALLEREIGIFFGIGDAPAGGRHLGTVRLHARAFPGSFDGAGVPLSLHSGSHDYDIRRSHVHTSSDGVRTIDSYDTGSVLVVSDETREVDVYNVNAQVLAVDSKRVIRDQVLVPFLESLGGVTYHSAAFELDGTGFLVAGDRGAGKTTVFFSAMLADVAAARFLSCERTVVLPVDDTLLLQACPEIISLFPGTLRSFAATRPIAPVVGQELEWARPAKKQVGWRQLFDLFGVVAEASNPRLSVVLLPRWTPGIDEVEVETLTADEAEAELIEHQMTHRNANKPNWLGWFTEADSRPTARRIAESTCLVLRWPDPAVLTHWFERFTADRVAVAG